MARLRSVENNLAMIKSDRRAAGRVLAHRWAPIQDEEPVVVSAA